MKRTVYDRGLGWVQRRFARPLDKGLAPSPVSNDREQTLFSRAWRFQAGVAIGGWLIGYHNCKARNLRSAFWAGMYHAVYRRATSHPDYDGRQEIERLSALISSRHREVVEAKTEATDLRIRLIAVGQELSELKRKTKTPAAPKEQDR